MTTVLGINMSHYASACLIIDGVLVAAIGEERLNRMKFSAAFPELSIRKVLEIGGISGKDVDLVAVGTRCEIFDSNKAQKNEYRKTTRAVSLASQLLPTRLVESDFLRYSYVGLIGNVRRYQFFSRYLPLFRELGIPKKKIRYFDHHTCHTAVAYHMCPWPEEPVLIFSCDGNGDGLCATVATGADGSFQRQVIIPSIHSIGGLYARTTKFLGMAPWQDEYKVMGMAPWGEKRRAREVAEEFSKLWSVDGLTFRNNCGYAGDALVNHLNRRLCNRRFDHLCYGVQNLLEDIMTGWIHNNARHFGIGKIACAGGVFLNVKSNKRIGELEEIEDMFFFPASGDDCISVGAAILGYRQLARKRGGNELEPLKTVYWGEPIDAPIKRFVDTLQGQPYRVERSENINERIASLLAEDEIVARCTGRMEFGPRALGNRSILANPSNLRNVQRLNAMIKQRDFWMPFAGTVLDKFADRYLLNPKGFDSHYMIMSFDTKPEAREEITCACHQADHTIRPQILVREYNPDYYDIIERFEAKSGIGAVLNTSLNLHGDPMVNLPEEAFHVLRNSALNHLALGPYLISKEVSGEVST
ncbi:hypothetical protein JW905_19060 [bacterium]|nr:hypothetical protein [candidate division CSSED10-310 bacterium]